jgi:hypothetical protein
LLVAEAMHHLRVADEIGEEDGAQRCSPEQQPAPEGRNLGGLVKNRQECLKG